MYWDILLLMFGVSFAQQTGLMEDYSSSTSGVPSFPYEASRAPNMEGNELKAVPRNQESPILLPKDSRVNIQDNRLQYTHGFSDVDSGISVKEQGSLLSTNEGWEYVIVKKGSYSYTSPEGVPVTVNYVADHNGFRIID